MLREERRGDGEASRGRQGETAHRGGRNGVVDGGRLWRRAEELVGRIVVLRPVVGGADGSMIQRWNKSLARPLVALLYTLSHVLPWLWKTRGIGYAMRPLFRQ
jgi:hypothetical protein